MKRKPILLAVIALAAAVLMGGQVLRLHAVTSANDDLRRQLAEAEARRKVRPAAPKPKEAPPPTWEQTQSELVSLTKAFETESARGFSTTLARARLHQRLRALSPDDLLALRTRLDQARLPPGQWVVLESALQWVMAEKAPARLLRESTALLDETVFQSSLNFAFWRWMKIEPEAAMAWLDKQTADGVFHLTLEGDQPNQLGFQKETMSVLLADKPSAAEAWLCALEESTRGTLLDNACESACEAGRGVDWTKLVLSVVPAGSYRDRVIGDAAFHLASQDSLEAVGPVLDLLQDPKTRQAAITRAAGGIVRGRIEEETKPDQAALDKVAAWIKTREPKEFLPVTGRALGGVWHPDATGAAVTDWMKREAAADGGDDLVTAFLEEAARDQPDRSDLTGMLSLIRDPGRRERTRTALETPMPPPEGVRLRP